MQEPCKVEGNENTCRKRAWRTDPKGKAVEGVKKDDTMEKMVTL
jgi:hypothetical protein